MKSIILFFTIASLICSQLAQRRTSFSSFLPTRNLRFSVSNSDQFSYEQFLPVQEDGNRVVYLNQPNIGSNSGFLFNFLGLEVQTSSLPRLKDFFREYNGERNNLIQSKFGSSGSQLARMIPAKYKDGISQPFFHDIGPREISNQLGQMKQSLQRSRLNLSMAFTIWGQFIDHDISLTQINSEEMDIKIPKCDEYMDPDCYGDAKIPFKRSVFNSSSAPREQINSITSWIDASMVYGSSKEECDRLRSFRLGKLKQGRGRMLPKRQNNHHDLLDAGDMRANENIILSSYHTIFVRQHNRICDLILQASPGLSEEQVFQAARNYVIALIQKITYQEFLPHLLGPQKYDQYIGEYKGYDQSVDPSVTTEFSTAAFRIGHSLLVGKYPLINRYGEIQNQLDLNDMFFKPNALTSRNMNMLMRGIAKTFMKEKNPEVINEVRNLLIDGPQSRHINLDLFSLNIQRSADHGLGYFNEVREAYGMKKLSSFAQMTKNEEVVEKLTKIYQSPDKCDLWIGIISEDPVEGGVVGELAAKIIGDQFRRLRDGDRYFYKQVLPITTGASIGYRTFSEVIMSNTGILNLQRDIFVCDD